MLFFLNAQGRILGDANLFCFEDHLLLDTEPETRQKLFEHLDRYIIADDVTMEDETETHRRPSPIEGPQAGSVLSASARRSRRSRIAGRRGARTIARINSTAGLEGFFIFAPAD